MSELEVVFLFGLLYHHLDFPFVVTAINDAFPDCEGVDPITGKTVNIEFEYLSRHYLSHGHPLSGCDYIVCWEDNWPESPIPVISLKIMIEAKNLKDKLFLDIPRPGSIRERLEQIKEKNPIAYNAVRHFMDVSLPKVQKIFPDLSIDEHQTRHYGVKYRGKGGLVGFYPNGRLICSSVDYKVKKHGEEIRRAAQKMRKIVNFNPWNLPKKIKKLRKRIV